MPAVRWLVTPLTPTAKATDENLASEDWDTNLQICDKVGDEGQNGYVVQAKASGRPTADIPVHETP